jgi:hypothetical protein
MPNGLIPTFTHGFSRLTPSYSDCTKRSTFSRRQSSRPSVPPVAR